VKWLAVLLLLTPALAYAQPANVETVPPSCNVVRLAAGLCAPARLGTRVRITNTNLGNDTNCASGSGAFDQICEYNGTAWVSTAIASNAFSSQLGFCGQGVNADDNFLGPGTAIGEELVMGNTACDANDSTTETTADDIPNGIVAGHAVVGMICQMTDTGTDDTVTFQLRDDAASVTGVACTVTLDGSGTESCRVAANGTIAAGSAMAVSQIRSDNDDLSASDALCVVFTRY
jgi:hypothetical protein